MQRNKKVYLGWMFLVAGLVGALIVAIEAITLPLTHGSGLAQADFELFVLSILIGIPVILLSVIGVFVIRQGASPNMGQTRSASVLAAVNVAAVTLGAGFALLIRSLGFFWK